jgi:hemerythrin
LQKCDAGGESEEVIGLFNLQDSYTRKHFSYEENLQKYNNYHGLGEQQKQHTLFLAEQAELNKTLEENGLSKKLTLITKGKLIRGSAIILRAWTRNLSIFSKLNRD